MLTVTEIKALLLRDESLSRLDVPRGRMEEYATECACTLMQATADERDAVRALCALVEPHAGIDGMCPDPDQRGALRDAINAVRALFPGVSR